MFRRVYVKVVAECDENGKIRPLRLEWENGRIYEVDRVLDVRRSAATKAGGHGIRYTVRINGHETYIFQDEGRWFVESKEG